MRTPTMPRIFAGQCSNCGYRSTARAADSLALRRDDYTFEQLAHPGEGDHLKYRGYTRQQALREDRLAEIRCLLCEDCGNLTQHYRPPYEGSYLIHCVGLGSAFLGCTFGLPSGCPWGIRIALTLLLFSGFTKLYALSLRPAKRRRQAALPAPTPCQTCGSDRLYSFYENRVATCPGCGVRTFRYVLVGTT